MPPYYHGPDWLYVWPYSIPLMEEYVSLVCNDNVGQEKRPNWPEDYIGLRIGNNTGYDGFGGAKFREYVAKGRILLEEAPDTGINLQKLLFGRIDCYMANSMSFQYSLKQLLSVHPELESKAKSYNSGFYISSDYVYLGVSEKASFPYETDFLRKFNNALYKLQKSGEVKKIVDEVTLQLQI